MQTLSLSLRNRVEEGDPLPTVFHQLDNAGVKFRRGWLHLLAAAPGGGKSAFAAFLALKLKLPTLYFSADNDILTFSTGAIANALNITTNKAERLLKEGNEEVLEKLQQETSHLWVSFQAGPSPEDIRQELDAFATVYGDWPAIIVIDNLMDVDPMGVGGEEWRSQDAILDFLKRLARMTGAAVFVLAHVTGEYTDGTQPIPRSGLMNKIDKRPQVVLTFHYPESDLLGVSVVKNRRGRAKADGSMIVDIPWMPEMFCFGTGRGE